MSEAIYREWLRLANDPSQTEQARCECRAKLESYTRERLRAALGTARAPTAPPSEPNAVDGSADK